MKEKKTSKVKIYFFSPRFYFLLFFLSPPRIFPRRRASTTTTHKNCFNHLSKGSIFENHSLKVFKLHRKSGSKN